MVAKKVSNWRLKASFFSKNLSSLQVIHPENPAILQRFRGASAKERSSAGAGNMILAKY